MQTEYNQAMSSNYLENNGDDDDQVLFLYKQLMELPFQKKDTILQIERSLYEEFSEYPDDELIYIALMQVQTMLGNYEKAKAFAYKLWDKGANLGRAEKYLYINNLLNISQLDMASILLKSCFVDFNKGMQEYFAVILKYATMTANANLLERIFTNPNCKNEEIYYNLFKRYKNYNYLEHFKNIQKILLNNLQGKICVYDYEIIGDVLSTLEISLYVCIDTSEIPEYEKRIAEKIQEYNLQAGIEKMSSFSWKILPISSHSAMGLN